MKALLKYILSLLILLTSGYSHLRAHEVQDSGVGYSLEQLAYTSGTGVKCIVVDAETRHIPEYRVLLPAIENEQEEDEDSTNLKKRVDNCDLFGHDSSAAQHTFAAHQYISYGTPYFQRTTQNRYLLFQVFRI